jgi:hypothetical protein
MIGIITIWYLPFLLLSLLTSYIITKKGEGKIKDFLTLGGLSLIPVGNIALSLGLSFILFADFITHNKKIQNFLNKEL